MQVSVEREPESKAILNIELDQDEVAQAMDEGLTALARRMTVPGFRKGKAPRAIVQRQLGQDRVMAEALDRMIPKAYRQAVEQTGIEPIAEPEASVEEFDEHTLKLKITVTVQPEVKLGEYLTVKDQIPREQPEVTDEQIDEDIENLRQRLAKLVEAEEQVVKADSVVVVDLAVYEEGKEEPIEQSTERPIDLSQEGIYPEVKEALIGVRSGEETAATVTVPDDHPDVNLRGKRITLKFKVLEVKERQVPELDDEFAKQAAGCESVQDLREMLKKRSIQLAEEMIDRKFKDAVIEKVVNEAEVDLPSVLTDRYYRVVAAEFDRGLQLRGLTKEDYFEAVGKTQEQLEQELMDRARNMALTDLVLDAIAKERQLVATDEDIDKELRRLYGRDPAEIRTAIGKTGRLESVADVIVRKKTIALLAEGSAEAWFKDEAEVEQTENSNDIEQTANSDTEEGPTA